MNGPHAWLIAEPAQPNELVRYITDCSRLFLWHKKDPWDAGVFIRDVLCGFNNLVVGESHGEEHVKTVADSIRIHAPLLRHARTRFMLVTSHYAPLTTEQLQAAGVRTIVA